MVEDGRRSNYLLEQVAQKRKEKASEEQALQMIPDFKMQLGNLIATKLPPPEVITRDNALLSDEYDSFGNKRKSFTKLVANIPLEDGTKTAVTIQSSAYPKLSDPDSLKDLDYRVNVEELDSILVINKSQAYVQSKKIESEPFTMHTPIGAPVRSWPAWQRSINTEDIQQYQELLDGLSQDGVTFEGSTPPIIRRDYSKLFPSNFKKL